MIALWLGHKWIQNHSDLSGCSSCSQGSGPGQDDADRCCSRPVQANRRIASVPQASVVRGTMPHEMLASRVHCGDCRRIVHSMRHSFQCGIEDAMPHAALHLATASPPNGRLSQSEQQVAPLRHLVTANAPQWLFRQWNQWVAPLRHLVTQRRHSTLAPIAGVAHPPRLDPGDVHGAAEITFVLRLGSQRAWLAALLAALQPDAEQ